MIHEQKSTPTENTNPAEGQGKFAIQRIYVKEQSAKVPYAPGIYAQEGKPETGIELNIQNRVIDENQFEVTLSLTVNMKANQQTALTIEVTQAGLFELEGYEEKVQAYLLGAYCPTILFPYARKIIADLSFNAGFMAITLPPINFEQLHQQRTENAEKAKKEKASGKKAADVSTTEDAIVIQ